MHRGSRITLLFFVSVRQWSGLFASYSFSEAVTFMDTVESDNWYLSTRTLESSVLFPLSLSNVGSNGEFLFRDTLWNPQMAAGVGTPLFSAADLTCGGVPARSRPGSDSFAVICIRGH